MNKHLQEKIKKSLTSVLENHQFSNGQTLDEILSNSNIEDEIDDMIDIIVNLIYKDILESSFEFKTMHYICPSCAIEFGEFEWNGVKLDILEILKNGRKILPL